MIKTIYNLTQKPISIIVSWVIFLLSPVLSIIRIKYLLADGGFKFGIHGLSPLFFYGPYAISFFVFLMIVLWFRAFAKNELRHSHINALAAISVMSIFFLMFAQYLLGLEFNNYPNYLYRYYGITTSQLQLMSFVAGLQLTLFIAFMFYQRTFIKSKKLLKEGGILFGSDIKNWKEKAWVMLCFIGISIMLVGAGATLFNWRSYLQGSIEGYEGKVGMDYKYINSLALNTPSETDTKLIHPPQGDKYPAVGNQPVIRYFLFPRTLVSGEMFTSQEFTREIDMAFFIIIDKGGTREWPLIDRKMKTIIFNGKDTVNYSSLKVYYNSEAGEIYEISFN